MKVTVNGQEMEIFSGAQVRDALLHHSREEHEAAEKGEKRVYDAWGNEVALDGELSGDELLETR